MSSTNINLDAFYTVTYNDNTKQRLRGTTLQPLLQSVNHGVYKYQLECK